MTEADATDEADAVSEARAAMRAAERAEALYMHAMFAQAGETERTALGMSALRIGGGVVTVMRNDPTGGYWSRVIGLGIDEPVTDELVDEVIAFAVGHGARSLIWQTAPDADGDWQALLTERGASARSAWVKFATRLPIDHPEVRTDLRVGPLPPEQADAYALVLARGFAMPEDPRLLRLFADTASFDGFRAHGAWDGERLVAVGTSYSADGMTALCGAATDPDSRGHGGQTALMAARFGDAAAAGSTWLTCETYVETDDTGPNPSLHNMRRMGLVERYERRNWSWQPS